MILKASRGCLTWTMPIGPGGVGVKGVIRRALVYQVYGHLKFFIRTSNISYAGMLVFDF